MSAGLLLWHALVVGFGLAMAASDAHRRRVPNTIPACLVLLFAAAAVWFFPSERSIISAAIGLAVLCIGFLLFVWAALPGGDAKALAASATLISPADWFAVLAAFWLLTLVLALAQFAIRRNGSFPLGVPIGVTVAAYSANQVIWSFPGIPVPF